LDELSVCARIHQFLENRFGADNVGRADVDLVGCTKKVRVQVECKGSKSNLDRALGQCLRYYIKNKKIPLFLGVPEDYHQLDMLNRILNELNLPFGLLIVKTNGKIIVGKAPIGAEEIIEKLRFCPKCGNALYSIIAPTGELVGYRCLSCGTDEKVDSSTIAQFIDLDEV
jgi:ribosomal protein S27AE